MTHRYTIAVLSACLAVLMLAAALAADRLFLAWIVTMFFFAAAAMGTDAELEMRIRDMERAGMICASVEKAHSIVLKFRQDEVWQNYLMWDLGVEDI